MLCLNLRRPTNLNASLPLVASLAVSFLFLFAAAQSYLAFTSSLPTDLQEGEPFELRWEGGIGGSTEIRLLNINEDGLFGRDEIIADVNGNSSTWTARPLGPVGSNNMSNDYRLQIGQQPRTFAYFSLFRITGAPASVLSSLVSSVASSGASSSSASRLESTSSSSTAPKHSKTAEPSSQTSTSPAGTSNGMTAGTKAGSGLGIPLGILLIGGAGFFLGRRLNGKNTKLSSAARDNPEVVENGDKSQGNSLGWKFWSIGRAELPTTANAHELPTEVESRYELDGGGRTER